MNVPSILTSGRVKMANRQGKRQRVERVIQEVISRRETGLEIDYASLERTHADLMPLLSQHLHRLKNIERAVRSARRQSKFKSSSDHHVETHDEDLCLLREALEGYQVLHLIEYGGQGVVYKAIQEATKRPVALKILIDGPLASEHQRKRFAREVEFTGRLRHPNIVTIYESGVVRGRPFFAMEYIHGAPVDQYVRSMGAGVREIICMMKEVCLAVSAAHQRGIIHRDLKPANVLVDSGGVPHVLDFGLARDIALDNSYSRMSIPGQVVGTLPYLSPEQVDAEDDIDVRSDIYTLGVVLFELLCGRSPYPNSDDRRVVRDQILNLKPISLRRVLLQPIHNADDLEKILAKTLEKDKSMRYQSAAALADDLQRYLDGDAVAAKDQNRMYLLNKAVRKFRIPIAITAVFIGVLFAALIGVTAAWRRSEELSKLYKSGLEMGAYVKMASVARDEGRVDQAIKMFEQAIQFDVLGDAGNSTSPLVMWHVYNAKFRLADLLLDIGRKEEAQANVVAAVGIADSMSRAYPDDKIWQLRRAFARQLSGKSAAAKQDYETACKEFEIAVAEFGEFSRNAPDNLNHRLNQGYTLGWLGKCDRELSRPDAAHVSFVEARSILSELVTQEPKNTEYQIELARIGSLIGLSYYDQMDYESATNSFRASQHRLEALRGSKGGRAMAREIDALIDYNNARLTLLDERSRANLDLGGP
jgi:tetratricopeptide (TPR) repeat protein